MIFNYYYPEYESKLGIDHSRIVDLLQVFDTIPTACFDMVLDFKKGRFQTNKPSSVPSKSKSFFWQCPKLRVHPPPGVQISVARCMNFGSVYPECARFLSYLSLLHTRRVHGEFPGCTVLGGVHTVGAQNKTLISDTVWYFISENIGECFCIVYKVDPS